jgi:hypothetical protein
MTYHLHTGVLDRRCRRLLAVGSVVALAALAAGPAGADEDGARHQFTFSWPFTADDAMRPRGGTTRGPAVQLLNGESAQWRALHEAGLSKFERDRRAILAMAGGFRSSFDFIETVGFTPGYVPARPYQSWSTEYVDVIEDAGTEISLQHIIVMYYVDDSGDTRGPVVQKHWRQDWTYEDPTIHEFVGHGAWRERRPDPAQIQGLWAQAVYQVDDSPRYEAYGRWVHTGNYSSWTSEETWRPLPRRESSVRDDYDVLIGTNRHTITPTGWVHEQNNLKAVLEDDGSLRADRPYLAREVGLNRYELIEGFDFSARRAYWDATSEFWADVRAEWERIYAANRTFRLAGQVDGTPLFAPMFDYAAALESGEAYAPAEGRAFIRDTLERYLDD